MNYSNLRFFTITLILSFALMAGVLGCEYNVSYEYQDKNGQTVKKHYSNTDKSADEIASAHKKNMQKHEQRMKAHEQRMKKMQKRQNDLFDSFDNDAFFDWDSDFSNDDHTQDTYTENNNAIENDPSLDQFEYDNSFYKVQYPRGWKKVNEPDGKIDPLNEVSLITKNIDQIDPIVIYNTRNDRQYIKISISPVTGAKDNFRNINTIYSQSMHNYSQSFQETMERDYGFTNFSKSQSVGEFKNYRKYYLRLTGSNTRDKLTVHFMIMPNQANDLACSVIYTDSEKFAPADNQIRQEIIDSIQLKH